MGNTPLITSLLCPWLNPAFMALNDQFPHELQGICMTLLTQFWSVLQRKAFSRAFSGYFQSISRIFPEHFQSIPRVFSEYFQGMFRVFPEYSQGISRVFSGYFQVAELKVSQPWFGSSSPGFVLLGSLWQTQWTELTTELAHFSNKPKLVCSVQMNPYKLFPRTQSFSTFGVTFFLFFHL